VSRLNLVPLSPGRAAAVVTSFADASREPASGWCQFCDEGRRNNHLKSKGERQGSKCEAASPAPEVAVDRPAKQEPAFLSVASADRDRPGLRVRCRCHATRRGPRDHSVGCQCPQIRRYGSKAMAGSPCLGWAYAARPGQVRRKPRLSPKSRSIGPAQAKGARELADKGLRFADEAGEPAARDVAVASLMTSEGCRRVRVGSLVAARAVLRRLSSGYVQCAIRPCQC
jgi:hypothetical protein